MIEMGKEGKALPKLDLRHAEGAKMHAKRLLGLMRMNFERDQCLAPVGFIFAQKDPKTGARLKDPIMAVVEPKVSKEDVAAALTDLGTKLDAVGIMYGSEAYRLYNVQDKDLARLDREGLANEPGRVEVVHVILDHLEGQWTWTAEIFRDGKTARLGVFMEETVPPGAGVGRMMRLLVPKPKALA
jgi:hypothetical protein